MGEEGIKEVAKGLDSKTNVVKLNVGINKNIKHIEKNDLGVVGASIIAPVIKKNTRLEELQIGKQKM